MKKVQKTALPSYIGAIGARVSVIHGNERKMKQDFRSPPFPPAPPLKLNRNLPS